MCVQQCYRGARGYRCNWVLKCSVGPPIVRESPGKGPLVVLANKACYEAEVRAASHPLNDLTHKPSTLATYIYINKRRTRV